MLPAVTRSHRTPVPWRVAETTPMPESRLDRVRMAAAGFVRGTTFGWGRRELAEWLVCQYSPCATRLDGEVAAPAGGGAPEPTSSLDEGKVEAVILDARSRTLRLLSDLVVPWQASPIARLSVAAGIVAAQRDPRGGVAYAPVALPKMRLRDRVASLFIADYLNRPSEYRWLVLCRECGELAFASELEHAASCEADPEQWLAFTPADAILLAAGG